MSKLSRLIKRTAGLNHSPSVPRKHRPSDGEHVLIKAHRIAIEHERRADLSHLERVLFPLAWPLIAAIRAVVFVARHGRDVREECGRSRWRQFREIWTLSQSDNIEPESYYKFRLFIPDRKARVSLYIQRHEIFQFLPWLNRGLDADRINDKLKFHDAGLELGLPVIPILAFFNGDDPGAEAAPVELPERDLFLKPSRMCKGAGAEKWSFQGDGGCWRHGPQRLDAAGLVRYAQTRGAVRPIIIQPCVKNHPDLQPFSGGGLCTLRVLTFRPPDAKASPVLTTFRMPVGASEVDNFSMDGLAAGVDEHGVMRAAVKQKTMKRFASFPDTGASIRGATLPGWREMVDLAVRAHDAFGELFFVGWDVALTEDGPVLVEGNPMWGADIMQIPNDVPIGETLFGTVLADCLKRAEVSAGERALRP
jgi:hypothetical protein